MDDDKYMELAAEQAKTALEYNDVPVGAVIVRDGEVIAAGYNTREKGKCATGHAEINAISEACKVTGSWRLNGCTMYVTLEPCPMCAGAAINARLDRIVYGAKDSKAGALGSVVDLNDYPLNHKIKVTPGVYTDECVKLLSDFFRNKRN
ncbi:MAG: tRNA adenosine(34) deaminase TadA [Clostridia bacterium]|nr:tRNA adenosine(34) deaminase TadA [Clostridia bacterium]